MTVQQVLEQCDNLKPNSYDTAQKLRWLSECEGQLWDEIILTHEDKPEKEFAGITEATPADYELVAPDRYASLYYLYLHMKIDQANNDNNRYQNSAAAFSAQYTSFSAWYNRIHMPLQRDQYMRFMRRR